MAVGARMMIGMLAVGALVSGASTSLASPPEPPARGVGEHAQLLGVTSLGAADVWMVGHNLSGYMRPFTKHFDGTEWRRWHCPNPGPLTGGVLTAVDVDRHDDAFAVGKILREDGTFRSFVVHWDGAGWHRLRNPAPPGSPAAFAGVAAVSPTNAWAVGSIGSRSSLRPVVQHWDGTRWSEVATPAPPGAAELAAVAAVSPTDIWAVGEVRKTSDRQATFVLHWDGTTWRRVATPSPPGQDAGLTGVSAVSSDDVWAVGSTRSASADHTFALHWDGTSWTRVHTADPAGAEASEFSAVSGASTDDVWAVGYSFDGRAFRTLTEHWDGDRWRLVESPALDGLDFLYGVSAVAADDVWAVGSGDPDGIVLHWDGGKWSTL